MTQIKCPGQDTMFWKPGDIFEHVCPECQAKIEFFKDDARRRCPGCGHVFPNPKLNLGCAKWCQFADKCLGLNPERHEETEPQTREDAAAPGIDGQDGL